MHRGRFSAWAAKNLRGKKGQQGFTLIELLVVVTILGILAGIVTLSLVGLTTHSNTTACQTEYKTVQAALDDYMAFYGDTTLPSGQSAYTNDMTGSNGGSVPLYNPVPTQSQPNFTRNGTTQFYYIWDTAGRINGIASDSSGSAVNGCTPH